MNKKYISYLLIALVLLFYYLLKLLINNISYSGDYIAFLNVGDGEAILVKSRGEFMLIDGGPSSFSSNKMYKYTFTKKPIAYLSTHYHSDHISGLIKALEDTPNYDVFGNVQENKTYQAKKLKNIVEDHFVKSLYAGDSFIFGDFDFTVLYPNHGCNSDNLNLCSIVLLAKHRLGKSVLLLSDSEKESQDEYLHLIDDVDYIKVPHHGSDGNLNKTLIKKANPEYAIISVGKNTYGHPGQGVMNFYKKQGTKILRTDEEGDIVIYFK